MSDTDRTAYSDDRPLACPQCKMSFFSEEAMEEHRQEHQN